MRAETERQRIWFEHQTELMSKPLCEKCLASSVMTAATRVQKQSSAVRGPRQRARMTGLTFS